MKRLALYASLALAVWLALWSVGRSAAHQAAEIERAEMHGRNAEVALRGYRLSRQNILKESRKREAAERRYLAERAKVGKVGIALTASLADARAILASDSASASQLRASLLATTERAEAYYSTAEAALALADSLRQSFHAERSALVHSLALADSTIAAQGRTITAWKQAAECRVLWMKCPTRVQVAVGVSLATLFVVKAAK